MRHRESDSPLPDMKLISLNTWGGKIYEPLVNFIKKHSKDTDIFCFQEVFKTSTENSELGGHRISLYKDLSTLLPDFQGYFSPTQERYIFYYGFVDFDLCYGLAIFIKKNIKILSHGDFFVFRKRNGLDPIDIPHTLPKNLQHLSFFYKKGRITICNYHGIWLPNSKSDSLSRIQQSQKIKHFLDNQKGEKILCGDFNLGLETQSTKIIESGMINLIKQYPVPTTRNKFFPGDEKFADYIFVSNEIKVKSFEVPQIEISDHLPMILEFS